MTQSSLVGSPDQGLQGSPSGSPRPAPGVRGDLRLRWAGLPRGASRLPKGRFRARFAPSPGSGVSEASVLGYPP
jgi:hypothetical protein